MNKAFQPLVKDHDKVKGMIEDLMSSKIKSTEQKLDILGNLKKELQLHEQIEEDVVYPILKKKKDLKDVTLEAYEEHHVVDGILDELEKVDPENEIWKAKLTVLQEILLHHIKEEEKEIFPEATDKLTQDELDTIETNIKQIKNSVN
ncbi:MAG: hemerythrin domain-containing protein [Burkholderiales bacterium]|nr:hemerythrin domain-containing protein [Burkholderiales bacterium]